MTDNGDDRNGIVDSFNLDAILDPVLKDNGCTNLAGTPSAKRCVKTHALLDTSPASEAANPSDCTDFDQIGEARNFDDSFFAVTKFRNGAVAVLPFGDERQCDIGAVQFSFFN